MTDKQIIIDGVDVSECSFFDIHYTEDEDVEIKHFCKIFHYHCETEPNCHYKQLKRKEQECERLKQGYSELTEIVSPYMDDFTGYNEELGGFDIVLCVKQLLEQLDQFKREYDKFKEEKQGLIKDWEEKKNLAYEIACKNEKLRTKNKELIKNYFTVIQQRNVAEQQLDQLKQERKALGRAYLTTNELLQDKMKEYTNLKAENETYKKMLDDKEVQLALTEIRSGERHLWFNKAEKLKQTLAEIKEIAEDFGFNGTYESYKTAIDQILQKINECEAIND